MDNCERFYQNMLGFTNFIKSLIKKIRDHGFNHINPDVVDLGTAIVQSYKKHTIIENFVYYSHKHWDQIHKKDEEFMKHNSLLIFEGIPTHYIESFKIIFNLKSKEGNLIVDDVDKEIIWEYFTSFIKISIKYIHEKRVAVFKGVIDGRNAYVWKERYMENINLREEAKTWGVELKVKGLDGKQYVV